MVDAFDADFKKETAIEYAVNFIGRCVALLKGIFLHRVYIIGSRRISFNMLGVVEVWIWLDGDLGDSLIEEELLLREETTTTTTTRILLSNLVKQINTFGKYKNTNCILNSQINFE